MTKAGIEYPDVIDVVSHDPAMGKWELIVVETGEWNGSTKQLGKLQTKLNNYLAFALDGPMHERYPDSVGKAVVIRMDIYRKPDQRTLGFLKNVKRQIEATGVGFVVDIEPSEQSPS